MAADKYQSFQKQDLLQGFTLSELLIAVGLLGVIAAFTIPKIVVAQQNQSYNAAAKEAIAAMAAAYQKAVSDGIVNSDTQARDLTPYLNYVSLETASSIDHQYNWPAPTTVDCSTANLCARLHNGAVIRLTNVSFAGTASTNAIYFFIDPDGVVTDGTSNGPGKSVVAFIYYGGRVTTRDVIEPNTTSSDGPRGPNSALIPPWYSW